MLYGTYTFPFDSLPLEERLKRLQAVGFDFVALEYPNLEEGLPCCEKLGFPVENAHLNSRGTSQIWVDTPEGDAVVQSYCEQIAFCAAHGLHTGIAHVTYGLPSVPLSEIGLRRFETIAECAVRHRFTLCMENSIASPHLDLVLERLQSPAIRYCYDSGHEIGLATGTPYFGSYLKNHGDRLSAMHLHDSIPGFDLHLAPFDGAIDWERVAKALGQTDYGRQKLCAEPGGRIRAKKEGKTAAELRSTYAAMAIAEDPELVRFYDGLYTVYQDLSLEEFALRFLNGLKKIQTLNQA